MKPRARPVGLPNLISGVLTSRAIFVSRPVGPFLVSLLDSTQTCAASTSLLLSSLESEHGQLVQEPFCYWPSLVSGQVTGVVVQFEPGCISREATVYLAN